jgi:hypothetical protein
MNPFPNDLKREPGELAQNYEAEKRTLGCAILNSDSRALVLSRLGPEDFYFVVHQKCIAKMRALDVAGDSKDLEFALCQEFPEDRAQITSLADGLHTQADVRVYIAAVIQSANLRRVQAAAQLALDDTDSSPEQIVEKLRSIVIKNPAGTTEPLQVRCFGDITPLKDFPSDGDPYIVDRILPANGVTMLAGPPGWYKSWLANLLGWSVVTGQPWLKFRTHCRPVLYLDRENTPARIRARAELLSVDLDHKYLKVWSKLQFPPSLGDPRLIAIAREYNPVIIVDTLIRFSPGKDENSASEVSRALELVAELTGHGASVLLLHHAPKNGGSWFRGSSDYEAFVDVGMSIEPVEKANGTFRLVCEKSRDGEPFTLMLQARPYLDNTGAFGVLVDAGETADEADVKRIVQAVQDHPGLNQQDVVKASGLSSKRVRVLLRRFDGQNWRIGKGEGNQIAVVPGIISSNTSHCPTACPTTCLYEGQGNTVNMEQMS